MDRSCQSADLPDVAGAEIRVRGLVQGVGFRPTVWRIAHELGVTGSVRNDGDGVLVRAWASDSKTLDTFCGLLISERPPLAHIDRIERRPLCGQTVPVDFMIAESVVTRVRTGVVPDAASCGTCAREIRDPADRRYRYPFTNCTHCGPRLSIVQGVPYDRANTSMAVFPMCVDCAAEYANPAHRRFHAQPNACPVCGPRVWLVDRQRTEPAVADRGAEDAVAAASRLLAEGRIVAIKGVGGFHLACDATNADTVSELRRRKRRWAKPFALMARDLDAIRHYCAVSTEEAQLLLAPPAPIVLLDLNANGVGLPVPDVAPRQHSLGFMLPYSPLHHLLLDDWATPLVMTSGNSTDEPQCIDNEDALSRLKHLADAFLLHDRDIVNRVDDSVARVMDREPRVLRRARGYAPAPLRLPDGFDSTPGVLALGGQLKSTICLVSQDRAVLSQHLGDLSEAGTLREYERTIALYRQLYEHRPDAVAIDLHPSYHSSRIGRDLALAEGLELVEVQHHRAHVAAVLADNDRSLLADPVVGIALDGSGYGDDGSIWGGEWFVGHYQRLERVGHLRPAALPGGTRAILEPWRSLYAQIVAAMGWDAFARAFAMLDVTVGLRQRQIGVLGRMIEAGVNCQPTSSVGRLFDAVAAALDICADGIAYEGQAAIELEAICGAVDVDTRAGYDLALIDHSGCWILDPTPMWWQLFRDLADGVPKSLIGARFHAGFADAAVDLGVRIAVANNVDTAAISGGVFQNRMLFERVSNGLRANGLKVLSHSRVPANDGGLALGQAVMTAASLLSNAAD
ncbi:MAG: carbamoyltransferase HypF [Thiohalocapsa sp.]